MKILITGGTGYIGTELCLSLMNRPEIAGITVYDNLSRKNFNFFLGPDKLSPKVRFIDADLLDSFTLRAEVKRADLVIHLAAKVSTPFADEQPHLFDQINNWGTAELSYALEASDCNKVIYMSSASVYGAGGEYATTETIPNPKTFYGISKLKGERHIARLATSKQTTIIRCSNVYGYSKSMRFDAVINRFALHTRQYKRVTINGNGEQERAFVHVSKVISFLEKLIFSEHWKPVYNLVNHNLSVNDIAYTLKEIVPELEMLYVDQQLSLRQVKLAADKNVNELIAPSDETFEMDLRLFLQKLA
jgi:UDP-glucose 4-epimerase